MRTAIIGAGISGLAIANILKEDNHQVKVFERADRPGGLVKCDIVDGHLFHRTGGHVFNSKRQDVLDWFWSRFDRDSDFTKALRNSVISMPEGRLVGYPIENHAYQLDDATISEFISDLIEMAKAPESEPQNFEEFLISRFGRTLYNKYFKPYNEKIWRSSLRDVPLSWLDGKLPMPTLQEILYNNFNHVEERQFVHSSFYYPKKGGSQFIVDTLSKGLDISYNTDIQEIKYSDGTWTINGETFDRVIYCGNVKDLPSVVKGIDLTDYHEGINKLKAHGTTTVLCEIDDNPYSWIYMPDERHQSHRIICTGNFSPTNRRDGVMSATIEFTDEITKDEILDNLTRIPFAPHYITHNYAPYTYPVQAPGTREFISNLKTYLKPNGLYLLGRFAEWEYYNMDVAIGAALDLSHTLSTAMAQ